MRNIGGKFTDHLGRRESAHTLFVESLELDVLDNLATESPTQCGEDDDDLTRMIPPIARRVTFGFLFCVRRLPQTSKFKLMTLTR